MKKVLDQSIPKNTKSSQLCVSLLEMIEKGVIRESEAESDLFAQLLGEEMIFATIIDLTHNRLEYVEAEGSFGELLATLKESAQSESEEESSDETDEEVIVLFNIVRRGSSEIGASQKSGTKNNEKRLNRYAFVKKLREGI